MLRCKSEIENKCTTIETGISELHINMHAAQPFAIDVLSHFHHANPDIRINMIHAVETKWPTDIIINACIAEPKDSGIRIIYKEDIVVAVPRILNPVYEAPITIDYINENELIGLSKKNAMGIIEEHYCSHFNLNLKHSIICDNPSVMKNLLINGTGLAFVPSKTWLFQNNPALNLVPFEIPNWVRYITISTPSESGNINHVKKFISCLEERIKTL